MLQNWRRRIGRLPNLEVRLLLGFIAALGAFFWWLKEQPAPDWWSPTYGTVLGAAGFALCFWLALRLGTWLRQQ